MVAHRGSPRHNRSGDGLGCVDIGWKNKHRDNAAKVFLRVERLLKQASVKEISISDGRLTYKVAEAEFNGAAGIMGEEKGSYKPSC